MPKSKPQNNQYYHIFNRGVEKRDVFCDDRDFNRFIAKMVEFNNNLTHAQRVYLKNRDLKPLRPDREGSRTGRTVSRTGHDCAFDSSPLVEIVCYNLLSNHYHLILKQLVDGGIPQYMRKIHTGYVGYFNKKNNRSGYLFESNYKCKHINSTDYLVYLSAYIHGNPEIHEYFYADDWQWSSYQQYLKNDKWGEQTNRPILSRFSGSDKYKKYVDKVIIHSGKNKLVE